MKRLLLVLSIGLIHFFNVMDCPAQKNILIYTHNGEGFVHDNIATSVKALKKLGKKNGYTMTSSDDPAVFTKENIKQFDCIIFSNTNNEAFDTEAQKEVFVDYIHNGGGFVGIHSAAGSERQWPWFWAMLGGKFVRHPKLQPFTIKVVDQDHPATSFLGDKWEWEDECYYLNELNPDIHILLAADLRSVEDDKSDLYVNNAFGHYTPIAWCHTFEGGRQFYTALGHKSAYYKHPVFLKHLLGGIKWVLQEE
ncbi:ThuA domain-containing protein [Fulvivirgaceae bacterium BMA10]|uniref:ThuA domain-containing protein n=1 Tax=Splendidivirga corallicola TaxID=3051826 RepID=A0ABT8KHP2_9BACT|nr:ThuA domain-containing protein [Fulvivirgaceae bacterium BMA10]